MRIARKVTALLTAGLLVGVGAVPTLASWTASEHTANTFTSAGFDVEVSAQAASGPYEDALETPGALHFTPSPDGLQPGDVVYASSWVRLNADSTVNGSLLPTVNNRSTSDTLKNASWAIYSIDTAAACDEGTATGTPVTSGNGFNHLAPEQHPVPLSAGADGQPGAAVHLCYAVTAHEDVEPNAHTEIDAAISAESTDQKFEDHALLTSTLRSGPPVGFEGATQDGNGPYGPHPQDQPGGLLFSPESLTPGATSTTAHLWVRPAAGSPQPMTLTDVRPTVRDGTTLQGSWQLNVAAADGTCDGTPLARGSSLGETTAVQPAPLRTDGATRLCMTMSFPDAQPGAAASVMWELRGAPDAHPHATASIFFAGEVEVPQHAVVEASTQGPSGPYAPHATEATAAALQFSPDQVAAGETTGAGLWVRSDAQSPDPMVLSAVTPTVGNSPGFDASWQLILISQPNGCETGAGTVLARGESLSQSTVVGQDDLRPQNMRPYCLRVTPHSDAPAGSAVNVTWELTWTATTGDPRPTATVVARGAVSTPAAHPELHVSSTGAEGSFSQTPQHPITFLPEDHAQSLRGGDIVYAAAWVQLRNVPQAELSITSSSVEPYRDKPILTTPWKAWYIGPQEKCDNPTVVNRPPVAYGNELGSTEEYGQPVIHAGETHQICIGIDTPDDLATGTAADMKFFTEVYAPGNHRDNLNLTSVVQAVPTFDAEMSNEGAGGAFSATDEDNPVELRFSPKHIPTAGTAVAPIWIRLTEDSTVTGVISDLPAPTRISGSDFEHASWEVIALRADEVCSPTADGTAIGHGETLTDHAPDTGLLYLPQHDQDGWVVQLCFRVTSTEGNSPGDATVLEWQFPVSPETSRADDVDVYAAGGVLAAAESPASGSGPGPDGSSHGPADASPAPPASPSRGTAGRARPAARTRDGRRREL